MKNIYIPKKSKIINIQAAPLMEEWWSIGVGDNRGEIEASKEGFYDMDEVDEYKENTFGMEKLWD